jgi:two-component system, chemotaxis family, CheB/CheR fusion protein
MNEELQSTNEELETMNDELNQRSAEIHDINNYLHSILSNIESGVIVLNRDLRVEVWNTKSEDLWGLRQDEVVGQSFFNLDSGLPVDQLKRSIINVLSEADKVESIEMHALNRRGRSIILKITISGIDHGNDENKGVLLILDVLEQTEGGMRSTKEQYDVNT